jgi:ribosomal protein S20
MNELDEKTGPINEKGTAGSGVGQGRTIPQSGTAQQKGIGKESQLSKIAAAVNPGSKVEANPTATQSMISTFMKTFEASAIEMRDETNDDQKQLIKTMIEEITKLQTKNMVRLLVSQKNYNPRIILRYKNSDLRWNLPLVMKQ